MQLSDSQKSSLKMFLQSPQYKLIEYIKDEYIKMVESNSSIRDTADETLKETYLKEGKIQGVKAFIQELFSNIQ